MRKRITIYMNSIDALLESGGQASEDWEALRAEHLIKIGFYQHERLVHLLVTMLVAILMVLAVGIAIIAEYPYMFAVAGLLLVLMVPYIRHYFFLENAVQKMYDQYDAIRKQTKHQL